MNSETDGRWLGSVIVGSVLFWIFLVVALSGYAA